MHRNYSVTKHKSKKLKRKKTKRPNKFIYYFFGYIVIIISYLLRKVKITYKCADGTILQGKYAKKALLEKKPPYIIVGNHHSLYDYVYMIRAFYPRRINFIIARKLSLASKYNFFLHFAHVIPKSLFQPDIQTIRESFDILQGRKGILALYPEGQIVINGISKDMPENSGKLIKKMKLPVLAVRTLGGYHIDSTWRKHFKRGIIDVEISVALTSEQMQNMTAEEIDDVIAKTIFVDNFAEQEKSGNLYKGFSRAEGLENILYKCPECQSEFTLKTKKHDIFCTKCNLKAEYTESAHLDWISSTKNHFKHIGEWYNKQREIERNRHIEQEKLDLSIPVQIRILSESKTTLTSCNLEIKKTFGIEKAGEGDLLLNNDGYFYKGSIWGKQVEIRFDPLNVRYIPYTPGDNFQIYLQDVMFAFHTKDPRMCAKAALVIETYYEKITEKQSI